jgi:Rrf2 family protein
MFSKACEYAIKACIFLAQESQKNNRVTPKQISEQIDSPMAFTAKILQELVKSGIVVSHRGAYGGFEIIKSKISTIRLSDIVDVIDGEQIYSGCGLGLEACNEIHPCPVHDQFKEVRDKLKRLLESTTLSELTIGLEGGITHLKNKKNEIK